LLNKKGRLFFPEEEK